MVGELTVNFVPSSLTVARFSLLYLILDHGVASSCSCGFFCVQCGKQPVSLHFNRFCTHCDYFRKLAPSNEPLRYRTKPSRDFLSHSRSPASHTDCLFRLQVPIRLFKIFFFALIGLFDNFYFTFTTRNRNGTQSPSILHPTCNFAIEGDYRITLTILHFHRFLLMRRL